jgi:poly-gamma-glutamate synthesis protein (capsule biosynthesis protein)
VRLFACGDVMTGRGVDQILPHPGDQELRERHVDDARAYVRLAERASGPIPRQVSFAWPWGDALRVLDEMAPDVRLINLETAVTCQADFAPGKGVHYRMSPRNLPCVAAARPDVCALANNHVMDFGRAGLEETLAALNRAGLTVAGAGRDAAAAWPHAGLLLRDSLERDPARLGRGHRAARCQLPAQPVRCERRGPHRPG